MRAMVIDCGFNLGFGLVGSDGYIRSGSHRLDGRWNRMGVAFRSMTAMVNRLIPKHKPDVIGACIPFVSFKANPINLIPLMGFYAKLQEIADQLELPFQTCYESDARKAFLAPAKVPRRSKDIKAAIVAACEQREWPVTDDHAADALCAADFILARLSKGNNSWSRLPLAVASRGTRVA